MKNEKIEPTLSKMRILSAAVALALCQALPPSLLAHEIMVHQNITWHAAGSATELSPSYNEFIYTILPLSGTRFLTWAGTPKRPSGWLEDGSAQEDNINLPTDNGGGRSLNHFYDPLSDLGLSDLPRPFSPRLIGLDSFRWASTLNAPGRDVAFPVYNRGTINNWSWQNAREYERIGLTDANPVTRGENLAKMFRALGQVVHLLQDTTQPQHARNEQHLDKYGFQVFYKSPIEEYGWKKSGTLNYTHGMLDWRAAGFTQLKDFWDRNLYNWNRSMPATRSAQTLIDSEDPNKPTSKLGLAEFVNGNFIGDRHTYREIIPMGNPFHYPFPSLDEGTDLNQLRAHPELYGKPAVFEGAGVGDRYIVGKVGQGRSVTYHGAVGYLVAANPLIAPGLPLGPYNADVRDPDVLKAYHDILIPEAIKYSAGVLDYFCRGRIVVTVVWDGQKYAIHISNSSGQDFSGGTFTLLRDDASGNRSPVALTMSYGQGSSIANGASIDGTFPGPGAETDKFLLVYQGSIGTDPVDANRAIAVTSVAVPCSTHRVSDLVWGGFSRSGTVSISGGTGSFDISGDNYGTLDYSTVLGASCNDYTVTFVVDYQVSVANGTPAGSAGLSIEFDNGSPSGTHSDVSFFGQSGAGCSPVQTGELSLPLLVQGGGPSHTVRIYFTYGGINSPGCHATGTISLTPATPP